MMKSIMSRTNLLESLWGEVVKTILYILNRVPSKSIPKTPFELWTSRKLSLNHFCIWGCPVEVIIYNLSKGKTKPKSTSC